MVGVPKSTGCVICRRRKIKCDETWPTCLNCQKNSKCCPGPPARHTFKDLGPSLITGANTLPTTKSQLVVPDSNLRYLTQVHKKVNFGGSVVHKFRISGRDTSHQRKPIIRSASTSTASLSPPHPPFLRQPSPSQHHELSRALVATISAGSVGLQMSVFGPFIQEVPARIGHNPALDAAVAVLINAHTSLMYKKTLNDIVSINLYLRAIKMLQSCLEDAQEGMSTNTLCASVLLGLVEALAGPRKGNRYLAHVGGAGRLMELQGPGHFHDPFAKDILRFNRGGIIVAACYEREPCFLAAPAWRDIAFDSSGLSFDERLHTDLLRAFAQLPDILKDLKDLNTYRAPFADTGSNRRNDSCIDPNLDLDLNIDFSHSPPGTCPSLDYSVDSFDNADFSSELRNEGMPDGGMPFAYISAREDVLCKVQKLRDSFCALGVNMNAKFNNGTTVVELPSMEEGSPIATAYHFSSWRDNVGYNSFWALCIMVNEYLIKLLPQSDPIISILESENRSLALEICKTWEEAWSTKPIGALHTSFSFVMAYEYVAPDIQEWIIRGINALLDYQHVDAAAFRWTDDVVRMMSGRLTGDSQDTIFSNVSATKEAR
ncbi:hypothetical protein BU25DRAFT_360374 [Macroventuria anomochaeta]|uniref:Uncharacterized protein n=1 Tax=Macroventuria anomochaeta TaxID=301207 RepID=A0ACB6SES1_9PLEO|nr:uncharacterized protein BU25DRAFT_360374 [Macroventuria anomochaeta]KAF2631764.1 hypothetical protein BU25DRAFT_360374 [Macroventuria anomochaeta]